MILQLHVYKLKTFNSIHHGLRGGGGGWAQSAPLKISKTKPYFPMENTVKVGILG